jgi:glucose/mannose-6-phosphate isomerase
MMRDDILGFAKQFEFEPKIENAENYKSHDKFLVVGMGGSNHATELIQEFAPSAHIIARRSYGLPEKFTDDELRDRLIIASSYSGNTEETIDALNIALDKKLDVAVIAAGGKLIETAKEKKLPYVLIPGPKMQPRSALGYSTLGMLKLMGMENLLKEAQGLSKVLDPRISENEGKRLATLTKNHVPVIYSSFENGIVAYHWKIKLNETGKIPAFHNVIPELNHNEMNGFDAQSSSKHLSEIFYFIFLRDEDDNPRIIKRMEVLEKLYRDRGLRVEVLDLEGASKLEKIYKSLLVADWMAVYTGEEYGLEITEVPLVEEFKKLL